MAPATMTWLLLRLGLLMATCALMPVPRWIKLATLGISIISAEFLFDLNLGNVSLIVTFFAVVAWRWLDRPASGVAIAASLAVRPAMGVIWIWWLVRRKWQAAAWTVIGLGAMFLVSLPFMGIDPWLQYVKVLRNVSDVMGVDRNLDFGSTALALGVSEPVSNMFLLAGYVLAIGAIVLGLRRDREIAYVVTLMATLLLSPLLWDHYLTNLIVPGALLAARGRRFGVLLPLLGWLPLVALPFVVAIGMLLPFTVRDRGEPALVLGGDEPDSIPDVDPSLSGAAGA
jgi:alpha-1,2-mannosyltransferase